MTRLNVSPYGAQLGTVLCFISSVNVTGDMTVPGIAVRIARIGSLKVLPGTTKSASEEKLCLLPK